MVRLIILKIVNHVYRNDKNHLKILKLSIKLNSLEDHQLKLIRKIMLYFQTVCHLEISYNTNQKKVVARQNYIRNMHNNIQNGIIEADRNYSK